MEAHSRIISVVRMEPGEFGEVVEMHGGHGLMRRLQALGIRRGVRLQKISAQFLWGPVTVKVGTTVLALGHGMASKVMVALHRGEK